MPVETVVAESEVVPVAPEQPAPAVVSPVQQKPGVVTSEKQAEAFAAHVAYVREKGDALDHYELSGKFNPKIRNRDLRYGALVALPTLIDPSVAPMSFIGFGGAIVGGMMASIPYLNKRNKRAIQETRLRAPGIRYDLFRVYDDEDERHQIVARLVAPTPPLKDEKVELPSRTETLDKMVELANDNHIKAILVPTEDLEDVTAAADRHADGVVGTEDWLARRKGVDVKLRSGIRPVLQTMYAFTPAQLAGLSRELKLTAEEKPNIDVLIEGLRIERPQHPLVRRYDNNVILASGDQASLRQTAERCLRQRLSKTTRIYDAPDGIPQSTKVSLDPVLKAGSVHWQHNLQVNELNSLLNEIGYTAETMHEAQQNYHDLSAKDKALVAEYTIYSDAMQSRDSSDEADKGKVVTHLPPDLNALLQDGSLSKLTYTDAGDKKWVKYRSYNQRDMLRSGVGGAAVLALGTLSIVPAFVFGDQMYEQSKVNQAEYAAAHDTTVKELTLSQEFDAWKAPKFGNIFLDNWYAAGKFVTVPVAFGVGELDTKLEALAEGAGGKSNPLQSNQASLGNSPRADEEKQADWTVDAHNMTAEGYWAQRTSVRYENGKWEGRDQVSQSEHVVLDKVEDLELSDNDTYMAVKRRIQDGDTGFNMQIHDRRVWGISIPVLNHTSPAAISYPGKDVMLFHAAEDTYIAGIYSDEAPKGEELQYILVPDGESSISPEQPNMLATEQQKQKWVTQDDSAERAKVQDMLDTRFPKLQNYQKGTNERTWWLANELNKELDYSLVPLPNDVNQRLSEGRLTPAELTAESLKAGKLICNTANSIIAFYDPDLTVAWGYMNNGDNELIGAEGHLWTVNTDNIIVDATPPRRKGLDNPNAKWLPLAPLGVAGLFGLGLLGHGVRNHYRERAPGRVRARIGSLASADLQRLTHITNMAGYRTSYDSSRLPPVDPDMPRDAAEAKLLNGTHATISVVEGLRQARKDSRSISDKIELIQTRSLIRAIHKHNIRHTGQFQGNIRGVL